MSLPFTPDQAKYIMEQTQEAMRRPELKQFSEAANAEALSSVGCIACKVGLNVACGAAIGAALAAIVVSGGAAIIPEVAVIAAATGLSGAAVTVIIAAAVSGVSAGVGVLIEEVIDALCKKMNACS